MSSSTQPTLTARMFDTLKNRAFRRLWFDSWFFFTCRWMDLAVLSWLVLELTNSASQVALLGIFRMVPMFLLGLVTGSLADRYPKKRMLIASHALGVTASSVLAVIIFTGAIQPWHTFIYMFLTGTAWTIDWTARRSYFSDILVPAQMSNAMSLDMVVLWSGNLIGPLLGGVLISGTGYGGTYAVITALYVVAFGILMTLQQTDRPQPVVSNSSFASQIVDAVRLIPMNSVILAAFLVTVTLNLAGFPYTQILPVIARDILDVGPVRYGVLGAVVGLGTLVGALVIASRAVVRQGVLFSVGSLFMLIGLLAFAFSTVYPLSIVVLIIAGFGLSGYTTMQPTLVIQAAPPDMRGRAMGTTALGIGAMPVGLFALGLLAERIGPQVALGLLTGAGILVLLLLIWRFEALRA